MIACKNRVCLVGLRSVGYRWIAGGWIYSKPVGWLVCLLVSVVWSDYGRWLACRLVCLLSSLSVGWAIRPACYIQPITVWPANHPSIYLIANQPTKDCTSINACIKISAWIFGIWGLTSPRFYSAGWLAVGLPGPCLQDAGQVWSVFHLASQEGIPSLLDRQWSPILGLIWERSKRGVWHASPCINTYSHVAYTAPSAPHTPYL